MARSIAPSVKKLTPQSKPPLIPAIMATPDPRQCRLLQLPMELQLIIYEYTVLSAEPLLINGGCSASFQEHDDYFRDNEEWTINQDLWRSGVLTAPSQPGLTRTCRFIRDVTLPMFYQGNVFRAHYCEEVDFSLVDCWLDRIGSNNRELLKDFCLWDLNPDWDWREPADLQRAREGKVLWKMGGSLETLSDEAMCCHRITFDSRDEIEVDDYFASFEALFEQKAEICS